VGQVADTFAPMARPEHESWRDELRDELRELEQAAIEAELETGRREETLEEAQRHLLVRVLRVTAGVLVCGVGIALLVLPGPGLVVLAAGLALLAQDVPFARRLLDRVRERLPEGEDGEVSKVFIVACSAGGVLFMSISVWWTVIR
jgi:Flp pilus assembly protein TadB